MAIESAELYNRERARDKVRSVKHGDQTWTGVIQKWFTVSIDLWVILKVWVR